MRYSAQALAALAVICSGCGVLVAAPDEPSVANGGSAPPPADSSTRVGAPASPSDTSTSPPPATPGKTKLVFVTSFTYDSFHVNDIGDGDRRCNEAAKTSLKKEISSATFVAWLSAGKQRAIARLAKGTVYVRPDGQRVGDTSRFVGKDGLENPIQIDEKGFPQVLGKVWTWTRADGDVGQGCQSSGGKTNPGFGIELDFGGDSRPTLGDMTKTTTEWTELEQLDTDCRALARLYCFET